MINTAWNRKIVYGALAEYVNGFLPATIPATLSVDTAIEVWKKTRTLRLSPGDMLELVISWSVIYSTLVHCKSYSGLNGAADRTTVYGVL